MPAVPPVPHVVRFAAGRGLVAAARVLASLVAERDQAAQVDWDVVGLAHVQRQGGTVEAFAQEVAAQEGGDAAGAGDDLQHLGQDLVLQHFQHLGRCPVTGVRAVRGVRAAGAIRVEGAVSAARGVAAEAVVSRAQADQHLDCAGVEIAGNYGDEHRVAGHGPGGVAVQPGAAVAGADRRGGAVRGPPGPVLGDPLVLEDGVLVQVEQLGEVDVHQRLDRLPGPLGQEIRGQQAPHGLFQRVVAALRVGAQVTGSLRHGQGVEDGLDHRGAFRGEIAADDSGPGWNPTPAKTGRGGACGGGTRPGWPPRRGAPGGAPGG